VVPHGLVDRMWVSGAAKNVNLR